MNRIAGLVLVNAALVMSALVMSAARADVVISTFDPVNAFPSGILRIDEESGTLLSAASLSEPTAGIDNLTNIAVGPDGNIYVTDTELAKVLYFDGVTGTPLPSPLVGQSAGVFATRAEPINDEVPTQTMTSLVFGPQGGAYAGDLFVVHQDLGQVQVYDGASGLLKGTLFDQLPQELAAPVTLSSAAFTPGGNLLVSDFQGGRIYEVDISAGLNAEVTTELIAAQNSVIPVGESFELFFPAGMAVDSSGDVYVANIFGNNILKLDSQGANAELVLTIGPEPTEPNFFNPQLPPSNFPVDLLLESDDSLLVAVLGQKNTFDSEAMPQATEGRVLRLVFSEETTEVQTLVQDLLPVTSIALIDDLLPGDYDGNGLVEAADYQEWKAQFGQSVIPGRGADGNRDGLVDVSDYTIWRDTLGASAVAPPAAITSAVPEAGTLGLMAVALSGVACVRRCIARG